MKNKVVLDASSLLALLNSETGYEFVKSHLSNAIMSSVNIAEVIAVLHRRGLKSSKINQILMELIQEIVPFDVEQSIYTGYYKEKGKDLGLSLGDCACFALAQTKDMPVITADKAWKEFEVGVEVILCR